MSALPPKADIAERDRDVRCVPKADILRRSKVILYSITSSVRPSSGSGILRPNALAVFRLITRSKFGRLHHRQIAGSLTLENTSGINACFAVRVALIGAVTHQASGGDKFAYPPIAGIL